MNQQASRRPLVALVIMLAFGTSIVGACGSSDDGDSSGSSLPDDAATDLMADDPRLLGNVVFRDIDLDGIAESEEVAAVLSWMAGGADDSDCSYFFRGFEGIEVGSGVGVLGDPSAESGSVPAAAVGESLFVCVAAQSASVRLVSPSGSTTEFPIADGESTTGDGLQVLRTSESSSSDDGTGEVADDDDLAAEYEVRSFPGADLGEYSLAVQVGDENPETFGIEFRTQLASADAAADDLVSSAKLFDFERYRYGVANPLAEVGTVAKFGLVGYPADTDIELAIYRSREEFVDAPPEQGGYLDPEDFELTHLEAVRTDDRGEAVLAFPLVDEVRGRCVLVVEAGEANRLAEMAEQSPGSYATGYGLDPRMLCIAG